MCIRDSSISIKSNVEKIEIKVLDNECLNGFTEIEVFAKTKNKAEDNEETIKNKTNILTKLIDKSIISLLIFTQKFYRKLFIRL